MSNINETSDNDDPAFNEGDRAAEPVNAPKRKIPNLALYYCDSLGIRSRDVMKRVKDLIDIQYKCDELEAKFFEERAALEAKYQNLYQPWYRKRYKIVNGATSVKGVANETTADTDKEKGVPAFWLNAMKNNRVVAKKIFEEDEGALKFLKDIKWKKIENSKGFKLGFFFDSNPYFSNSVLTKSYDMIGEKRPKLEKATGTEIKWYPDKSLTHKVLTTIYKDETYTRTEPRRSFFNFFDPPTLPGEDEIDEDMAYEIRELKKQIDQDYKIGSTIKDHIIPSAIDWFTEAAIPEDEEESEDPKDEEEDEGDEDYYTEDEDEDEDEDE